jgi:hypothetical protein
MFDLKPSELAAWYAACVSTTVFAWDVYKWLRGNAKIRVDVLGDMVEVGAGKSSGCFLHVDVANVGGRKTTLTHLAVVRFDSAWAWYRRRSTSQGLVTNPLPGRLPHELDVGSRWTGLIEQDAEIEHDVRTARLYVAVYHSVSKKPTWKRVLLRR